MIFVFLLDVALAYVNVCMLVESVKTPVVVCVKVVVSMVISEVVSVIVVVEVNVDVDVDDVVVGHVVDVKPSFFLIN